MTPGHEDFAQIITLLEQGVLDLKGLLPWSSNYTFLMRVCLGEWEEQVVYKPRRGERPLWDFTLGTLCNRERAAYLVSEALGWHLVPPTILRQGPHGIGSMQWFVAHDPEQHYFSFEGHFPEQLQRVALFDVLINNADRKSGHVLLGEGDRLWLIDHGICFHADHKLRTVIWEFAGIPIPPPLKQDLAQFEARLGKEHDPLVVELHQLLNPREVRAISARVGRLLQRSIFPEPGPGRYYPWPLV